MTSDEEDMKNNEKQRKAMKSYEMHRKAMTNIMRSNEKP